MTDISMLPLDKLTIDAASWPQAPKGAAAKTCMAAKIDSLNKSIANI